MIVRIQGVTNVNFFLPGFQWDSLPFQMGNLKSEMANK